MERTRNPLLTSLLIADAATGRVIAASEDVVKVGVAVGDSRYRAVQKAAFTAVIEADMPVYYARHDAAFSALGDFADAIETIGLGEFLLEWSSTRDFAGSGYDFQVEVLARVMQEVTGLTVQIGVATHRFTAQQAGRDHNSDGILVISPRRDARYLALLPVTLLPALPSAMLARLHDFGIYSLGQLAKIPDAAFARQFGGKQRWLRALACGRDPRPLHPDAPPLRLLREYQFDMPTPRLTDIVHVALRLTQRLSRQLDTQGYRAEGIRLVFQFADGKTSASVHALKPPTADRERLTWYVEQVVKALKLPAPVARLTLVTYPMRPWHEGSTQQLSLFEAEEEAEQSRLEAKQSRLEAAMRELQWRYGEHCVFLASHMPPPEPVQVQVEAAKDGTPLKVCNGEQWLDILSIEELWRKEWGWWDRPQRHDYYRVLLVDGTLRNLVRDICGTWYVDKSWLVL